MAVPVSVDALGWLAATLMVATRLAFIGYGFSAALAPVLALHALRLPINLWRWRECGRVAAPLASQATTVCPYAITPPGSGPAGTEPWPPVCRPIFTKEPR